MSFVGPVLIRKPTARRCSAAATPRLICIGAQLLCAPPETNLSLPSRVLWLWEPIPMAIDWLSIQSRPKLRRLIRVRLLSTRPREQCAQWECKHHAARRWFLSLAPAKQRQLRRSLGAHIRPRVKKAPEQACRALTLRFAQWPLMTSRRQLSDGQKFAEKVALAALSVAEALAMVGHVTTTGRTSDRTLIGAGEKVN